jgi:F-box and WD-40 domain protein CDC4
VCRESLAVLRGHTGLVGHLIIVGDKVISSSIDGTVRIWSLNEYMELGCIHEHEGAITELAYDGTRVLSGGADGNVKVWKLDKGEPMRELVRGADAVWGGGFIGGKVVAVYRKSGSSVMEVFDCPIL